MKVETKASSADLVTETDKQVEELILSELKQKFPSHKYRASVSDNNTCSGCGHPQCGFTISVVFYNNYWPFSEQSFTCMCMLCTLN